ncbi:hypothetical protein ALO_08922 [Acetonema longum DSM 6540]|uniref:Uncharacterized protein n=1 Tax=Acetonema longum DSM 6540 TaxID=1009370 RepID=F7NI86_9FIRM|nr:hypothetical protein ALO_08922 [Acetonema longum DSM 6540]
MNLNPGSVPGFLCWIFLLAKEEGFCHIRKNSHYTAYGLAHIYVGCCWQKGIKLHFG